MSLARFSASIRWSSDRSGAWACVFDVTMSDESSNPQPLGQAELFSPILQGFFQSDNGNAVRVRADSRNRARDGLGRRARRRIRAGAAGSAKSTVPSATAVAPAATSSSASSPVRDAAHPDDRARRPPVRTRRRTRARSACSAGPRVAAERRAELRAQRARVERQAADRVDERQPVRAGGRRPPAPTRRCPSWPATASRRAASPSRRGPPRRSPPTSRAPPRRSGTRGSARSTSTSSRLVEALARRRVVARPRSRRPRPRRHSERRERGQSRSTKPVDAGALQADRVQHPALGLGDPHAAGCPRAAAGVIVFVTNASSDRRDVGRRRARRGSRWR